MLCLPFIAADSMAAAARAVQVILQPVVVILSCLVVARMTAGAGGRVSRRRPIHRVSVRIVAIRAGEISSVVERFVGQAGMAETRWGPAIR